MGCPCGVDPQELSAALQALAVLQRGLEEDLSRESSAPSSYLSSPPSPPDFQCRGEEDEGEGPGALDLDEFMAREGSMNVGQQGQAEQMEGSECFWDCLEGGGGPELQRGEDPCSTSAWTSRGKANRDPLCASQMSKPLATGKKSSGASESEEGGNAESQWSDFATWDALERSCLELDASGEGTIDCLDLTPLLMQGSPGSCSSPGLVRISKGHHSRPSLVDSPWNCSSPGLLKFKSRQSSGVPFGGQHHNSPNQCGSPSVGGHREREAMAGASPVRSSSPGPTGIMRRNTLSAGLNLPALANASKFPGCASPGLGRLGRASIGPQDIPA